MATSDHSQAMGALRASPAFKSLGVKVVGLDPRDDHVLLMVEDAWFGGPVAVAIEWPDEEELTGVSTGEPVANLEEWAFEVALWLDEAFATAEARYVLRATDPVADHTVVRFAPTINPNVVREILESPASVLSRVGGAFGSPGRSPFLLKRVTPDRSARRTASALACLL